VKVFFIYEESPEKNKKRVFIPFRNKEAQTNIENDAEPLVESSALQTNDAESLVESSALQINDAEPAASSNGGRRRSSRKYKKRTRRIKSSKKRSYTTKYSRFRRYRK
jgi:hypothetical protein